jgi:hypothetical protein
MTDLCPTCGQVIPVGDRLTQRELEVLASWWMLGSVKDAAHDVGVGEQRAKNLLRAARIRNRVETNDQLVAQFFSEVLQFVRGSMHHKVDRREVA